jgi:superfamily II DNA or RNA helicase
MNDLNLEADRRFTPYQAEFFRTYVAEAEPGSVHVLLAPPGAGKTFVITRTISELSQNGQFQRVLLLGPAALTAFMTEQFRSLGQEAILIEGRSMRLLQERIGDSSGEWPSGIYAMGIDFAKRQDIRNMIVNISWDLVAIDEAHMLAGDRLQLVEDVAKKDNAPAILLSMCAPEKKNLSLFDDAKIIDWTPAVSEFRSRQNDTGAGFLARKKINFERSVEEISIADGVLDCAREIGCFKGMTLLSRASSSISCLEETLINGVENPDEIPHHRKFFESLLSQVEQIHSDTKLKCFIGFLQELTDNDVHHIAVFCDYRSTLDYLISAMGERNYPVYHLHGGIPSEQRDKALEKFKNSGGVLVRTAAVEGVSLNFADAVIHYDLPISAGRFSQREGSYDRYGRDRPCTVYVFEDKGHTVALEKFQRDTIDPAVLSNEAEEINLNDLFQKLIA